MSAPSETIRYDYILETFPEDKTSSSEREPILQFNRPRRVLLVQPGTRRRYATGRCDHGSPRYGQTQERQLSLARKAKLIRRIYRDIPDIAPLLPMVKDVLKTVQDLGERRHDIIHGSIEGIKPVDPPLLVIRRNSYKDGNFSQRMIELSVADIDQLAHDLFHKAAANLMVLTVFLMPFQKASDKSEIARLLETTAAHQKVPVEQLLESIFGPEVLSSLKEEACHEAQRAQATEGAEGSKKLEDRRPVGPNP